MIYLIELCLLSYVLILMLLLILVDIAYGV
jgi:hypothetical protein